MEVINTVSEGVLRIGLVGELDASGAIHLDQVIQQALQDEYYRIVVDCQRLDYISSAGLGVFISYLQDITDHDGKLVFYNMKENVQQVFTLLGLQNVVTITGDLQEAKKVIHAH